MAKPFPISTSRAPQLNILLFAQIGVMLRRVEDLILQALPFDFRFSFG